MEKEKQSMPDDATLNLNKMTNWEKAGYYFARNQTYDGARRYSMGARAERPMWGCREVINQDGELLLIEYTANHVEGMPPGTRYQVIDRKPATPAVNHLSPDGFGVRNYA